MMPLSTDFFERDITEPDRQAILHNLGLAGLPLRLVEAVGSDILRAQRIEGDRMTPYLQPWKLKDLNWKGSLECPLIGIQHHAPCLGQQAVTMQASLWECWLPYPLSELGGMFTNPHSDRFQVEPTSIGEALQIAWEGLRVFQKRVEQTELAFVWLEGSSQGVGLVLRHARGRRLKMGIAKGLDAIVSQEEPMQALKSRHGLAAEFFCLDIRPRKTWERQAQHIGRVFRQAAETPPAPLPPSPLGPGARPSTSAASEVAADNLH